MMAGWSDENDMDDLLDEIDEDLSRKKTKSVKQGRRAKKAPEPDPEPVDDTGAEEEMMTSANMNNDADMEIGSGPPKPSRRVGGWGEENTRRRGLDMEDERLRPRTAEGSDDDDAGPEIPTIPDLEETQEDDTTQQMAMAPNVSVNRVATYRELDNDLLRHAAFLTLDNEIDLKLLSRGLSAEADVQEDDKPWDWDRLFTEVTSELLTEWEKQEASEEEEKGVA